MKLRSPVIGSRHVVPKNMTQEEYNSLKNQWYEKLQKEGHVDIEYFDVHGRALAYFHAGNPDHKAYSGSSYGLSKSYTPEAAEYYRLCGLFLHHADWQALFPKKHKVYKHIFELHSNGMAYREIAKESHKASWPFPKDKNHSVFWSHWNIKRILKAMWAWRVQELDGLLADEG